MPSGTALCGLSSTESLDGSTWSTSRLSTKRAAQLREACADFFPGPAYTAADVLRHLKITSRHPAQLEIVRTEVSELIRASLCHFRRDDCPKLRPDIHQFRLRCDNFP